MTKHTSKAKHPRMVRHEKRPSARTRHKFERLREQIETTCIEADEPQQNDTVSPDDSGAPSNDRRLSRSLDGFFGNRNSPTVHQGIYGMGASGLGAGWGTGPYSRTVAEQTQATTMASEGGMINGHSRLPKINRVPNIPKLPTEMPSMTAEEVIPRGLQIRARSTSSLYYGFRYPQEFSTCGISKGDWEVFCTSIVLPLFSPGSGKIAWAVEEILDRVAIWDAKYFRPRGFIMRMDMPGEEIYGVDFMDLHHFHRFRKHVDNISDNPPIVGTGNHWVMKQNRKPKPKHHKRIRRRMVCSTRIILDPVSVMDNPEIARQRGWMNWKESCEYAYAELIRSDEETNVNHRPWDFQGLSRKDRWPPSKHLYYDRYRGTVLVVGYGEHQQRIFIPSPDSMDQRGDMGTSVLPADNIEFRIIPQGAPGHLPLFHTRYCEHV